MPTGPLRAEEIAELRERERQTIAQGWTVGQERPIVILRENAAFLVAAKNYVPRLLDEVEQSRAMLKRLEWSRISEATGSHEVSCPICKGPFGRHELDCELALLTWPTSRGRSAPRR